MAHFFQYPFKQLDQWLERVLQWLERVLQWLERVLPQ